MWPMTTAVRLAAIEQDRGRTGLNQESRGGCIRLRRRGTAAEHGQAHDEPPPHGRTTHDCPVTGRVSRANGQVGNHGPTPNLSVRRQLPMYHRGMDGVGAAIEALERVQLFAGLDRTALERLATGLRTRRFRRNEVLFHQGDPGDSLFIVTSGAVKITLPSEEGDEAILATVRPGAFFGELALLDGAPRSATAVAMEPTETLVLPRDRFRLLIDTEPATRDALLAALAGELRRLTDHVEELHFLDMTGRMAARLLRLAQGTGVADADGSVRLDGPYTQGDLASMIGATRQSVNKLLGQFVDDGLIRIDPDAIVILDLAGLERTAHR
jgi:CRP/FNR family cyclic AMP-dependent transcriptional regulator